MEPTKTPRVLSGRYELAHLVARGGMAEVYRAHDRLLDRPVALKVLFPELSVDRSFVERFRREAQAAANLSHPNIVPVFDWGEDGGTYFIVMEFVDGRPLSAILRTAGPLHPDRAAEIGADVAGALAYAHRHGVVHRDVKPGNVLITDEGIVKVTDFGIARAVNTEESLTQTGAVMGTATYFSPEQAEGVGVDSRSDIYSLGVVLFEMVCGRPPFLGESPVSVASKHVRETPPNPRDLNPSIPPDFEAIILKCMAKSADYRYATGDDLRVDLLRFRDGKAVTAVGAGVATQTVGFDEEELPSHTGWYVVALVVLLALLAAVVLVLGNSLHWWKLSSTNTAVVIPPLTGQTVTKAQTTLQNDGLKVLVQADPGSTAPTTQVVRTEPAAGSTTHKGDTVIVYSGSGTPTTLPPTNTVSVADYTNQSVTAAEADLQKKGLQAQVQFSTNCTQQNVVCSQSPQTGTAVQPNSTVTLFTQQPPAPTVNVPDVSNQTETAACNILSQAKLQCGTPSPQASATVASGYVISTEPPVNTQVPTGSSVNLVVSTGSGKVSVPNLFGLTEAQAVTAIQQVNLVPQVTCTPNPAGVGDVTSQNPAYQTSVNSGSIVNITVSATSCGATSTTALTAKPNTGSQAAATSLTFTVTVSGSGPSPTGAVPVKSAASTLCTITLTNGSGTCNVLASVLPVGFDQVTASYPGDANYAASTASTTVGITP